MAAEWGKLLVAEIRTAVAYYANHHVEIDDWIAANLEEAEKA